MFKPHFGLCICHNLKRWIVVKAGYCKQGDDERKNKKNKASSIQGKSIMRTHRPIFKKYVLRNKKPLTKKVKKATGEKKVFEEIFEEAAQESGCDAPTCRCCPVRIARLSVGPINFSHLLSKGAYPAFRLRKDNIWLCCEQCHRDWETTDRKHSKFAAKLSEANRLKQLYYA